MKIDITQTNLVKQLQIVTRAAATRPNLPILANVLLSTESGALRISATNLDIGITTLVGCSIIHEGSTTVPAKLLLEYITNLRSDETVTLEEDNSILTITSGSYVTKLNGTPADEYPSIPEITGGTTFSIDGAVFRAAVGHVAGAASLDETRPVLSGVYIYKKDDSLIFVATDAFRLAEYKAEGAGAPDELSFITPVRTINELARIAEDTDKLTFHVSETELKTTINTVTIHSRLVEGQSFPAYESLIPENSATTITVPVKEVTEIIKVASVFARETAGSLRVRVQAEGKLSLEAKALQVGESIAELLCDVSGDDVEVSLNSRFLSEAIGLINDEIVCIGLTPAQVNESKATKHYPCVIRPATKDNFIYIIMPLQM